MQTYRTEGIILHAFKFKDFDQIITLFAPEEGVIKLVVKGAFSSKNGKGTLTAPLSHTEVVYTKGQSELYSCREISMLNQHLSLRGNIALLEAAFDLIQATFDSQMLHKPAPDLYRLLVSYLGKLPAFSQPNTLSASYRLKILRHEGLLAVKSTCSTCGIELQHLFISEGESYCRGHAQAYSIEFQPEESSLLEKLAYCKTFSEIDNLVVVPEFGQKIKLIFKDLLQHG